MRIRERTRTARSLWFLGSSQLIFSIIKAHCIPEEWERCGADWSAMRITRGQLRLETGRLASFLSCNMATLGDPELVVDEVRCEPGLVQYLDMIDPDADVLISMLRGNEFVLHSLVDDPPRWDFSDGERRADSARAFVQRADVAAHADAILSPLFATLFMIRARFPKAAVYQAAPPPPLQPDSPHLNPAQLRADGLGEAADLADQYGVRPFAIRKKLYDLMYGRLAARLAEIRVDVLYAPTECLTSEGALRSTFAADCLHGNELYGRALVRALEASTLHAPL